MQRSEALRALRDIADADARAPSFAGIGLSSPNSTSADVTDVADRSDREPLPERRDTAPGSRGRRADDRLFILPAG